MEGVSYCKVEAITTPLLPQDKSPSFATHHKVFVNKPPRIRGDEKGKSSSWCHCNSLRDACDEDLV